MLEITLNARQVELITSALHLAADDWSPDYAGELMALLIAIIDVWVAQNPDEPYKPWESAL